MKRAERIGRMFAAAMSAACLAALCVPSQAAWAAPSCSELDWRWHSRYVSDFGVRFSRDRLACKRGADVAQMLALVFHDFEAVEYEANERGYRPDFYRIVSRNLRGISYDPGCKLVAVGDSFDKTITLCPKFAAASREDRAGTLVHEARHLERGDPRHVACVGGKFRGQPGACDARFHDGKWKGSGYNAEIFFLNWTLNRSRPGAMNELKRDVLRSLINFYLPDKFNDVSAEQLKKWRGN